MKFLKIWDRVSILLFNILFVLVSISIPALSIASTPAFYKAQFEKTGIYASLDEDGNEWRTYIYYIGGKSNQSAQFSNEQIDTIIHHIVYYLFTNQESFALTMDGVKLNGSTRDGVAIFGEVAIAHMEEVKVLFQIVLILTVIIAVLLVGLIVYFVLRWKEISPLLLDYSLLFYGIIFLLAGGFCLWTWNSMNSTGFDFGTQLWRNFHYLFFPFQSDKFAGSFFDDTLTQILTLDFFLSAVMSVLLVVGITLSVWFGVAIFGKIYARRKQDK